MAVAFDAVSTTTTTANSASWSHTCSGSDRCLYVFIGRDDISDAAAIACTYNSVAMTKLGFITDPGLYGVLFRLVNPATGANTVSASGLLSGGGQVGLIAISFTGVDQTTPDDTMFSEEGLSDTAQSEAMATASGDAVLSCINVNATAGLAVTGTGQTLPTGGYVDQSSLETAVSYTLSDAASETLGWSWTTGARNSHLAININAAAGAAAATYAGADGCGVF